MAVRARLALPLVLLTVASLMPISFRTVLAAGRELTTTTVAVAPNSVGPRGILTVTVDVSPAPIETDATVQLVVFVGGWGEFDSFLPLDGTGHATVSIDTTNWQTGTWTAYGSFWGTASSYPSNSVPTTFLITAPSDPPPAVPDPSTISAGDSFTCVIDSSGSLACWGALPSYLPVPDEGEFIDVAAGLNHACAVARTGDIACWGNAQAFWGDEFTSGFRTLGGTFLEVAAGSSHTCGIRVDHTLACWGNVANAELLDPPYGEFHELSSGPVTACALGTSDEIACWGDLIPDGTPTGPFAKVEVGTGKACGLRTDGSLTCWGAFAPTFTGTYLDVSSGGNDVCALRADGDIVCQGVLAGGPPALVEGPFDQLSVGQWHLCARRPTSGFACFGAGAHPDWGTQPLIVASTPLDGQVGSPYLHQFRTSGVQPWAVFTVVSGALPAGLSLSLVGALTGTPTARGASGPITVRASNGIAPDADQTFDVYIDPAPPVESAGPVVIAIGATTTATAAVFVATPAVNAVAMRLSNDGTNWEVRAYSPSTTWDLADLATGGSAVNGLKTVTVAWQDGAGSWTPTQSDTIFLDTAAPVVGTATLSPIGVAAPDGVPYRLLWSGGDVGSGIHHYDVQQSIDGGGWSTVAVTTATMVDVTIALQALTSYRIRAIDQAGNISGWTSPVSVRPLLVTRQAGPNRYSTAAAISAGAFSPGVPVAYVALGTNFPDALAAAAAAGHLGGPVLLVTTDSIPAETAAELARLKPGRIVVAGGISVVSDAVLAALDPYTTGAVTRRAGPNRYATAAAISAGAFSPGVPVAYVALGTNFPDALAAAAAAGHLGGPVLLVTTDSIPAETAAELARLKPGRIVVAGGISVVSDAVLAALAAY